MSLPLHDAVPSPVGRFGLTWSLDFVVVLTFVALMVPVVRTRADLAAAIVAAVVAMATLGLPYRLALIAGSIAGIPTGLAVEYAHRRRR